MQNKIMSADAMCNILDRRTQVNVSGVWRSVDYVCDEWKDAFKNYEPKISEAEAVLSYPRPYSSYGMRCALSALPVTKAHTVSLSFQGSGGLFGRSLNLQGDKVFLVKWECKDFPQRDESVFLIADLRSVGGNVEIFLTQDDFASLPVGHTDKYPITTFTGADMFSHLSDDVFKNIKSGTYEFYHQHEDFLYSIASQYILAITGSISERDSIMYGIKSTLASMLQHDKISATTGVTQFAFNYREAVVVLYVLIFVFSVVLYHRARLAQKYFGQSDEPSIVIRPLGLFRLMRLLYGLLILLTPIIAAVSVFLVWKAGLTTPSWAALNTFIKVYGFAAGVESFIVWPAVCGVVFSIGSLILLYLSLFRCLFRL